jgi:quercetin dioxygenase-like cupin family protein
VNHTETASGTVVTAEAMAALPLVPLGNLPGVLHRVLWQHDGSMAGVLVIDAGCRLGPHRHRTNEHHLWMLEGHAGIVGHDVGPGGYVHVAAGVDHDIDATATNGCTVYYLYIEPAESDTEADS